MPEQKAEDNQSPERSYDESTLDLVRRLEKLLSLHSKPTSHIIFERSDAASETQILTLNARLAGLERKIDSLAEHEAVWLKSVITTTAHETSLQKTADDLKSFTVDFTKQQLELSQTFTKQQLELSQKVAAIDTHVTNMQAIERERREDSRSRRNLKGVYIAVVATIALGLLGGAFSLYGSVSKLETKVGNIEDSLKRIEQQTAPLKTKTP